KTDPRYFVGMPITAGAACVAAAVVAWPDPVADMAHAFLVMVLMVGVGTLMVSTLRFPSSKLPKTVGTFLVLGVCLLLMALLRAAAICWATASTSSGASASATSFWMPRNWPSTRARRFSRSFFCCAVSARPGTILSGSAMAAGGWWWAKKSGDFVAARRTQDL